MGKKQVLGIQWLRARYEGLQKLFVRFVKKGKNSGVRGFVSPDAAALFKL
ncbi:hypothetical protein SAMN04487970_101423 [Paenibacillus tianmuensis]|uniref:Uncharacterized protein n=1 Tax=Paenibacillus tianmuensis TaxID=624147 RepID=A0A1G4RBN6_9BACL|nr:hypothetical protein [Paenibacillus tianmuensis]SCW54130.1 hypothetical protein SAMN04487970_101423 [Paenibacillus tianmuensis]